ncbi:MAG: hypothetical protein IPJ50_11800 [Betaproteobacteria bacterium]|nr:hypothetical protein [Betaproteobacteria bacterium]
MKQAKRYFEAGVGTITDINEVQARYDTIAAQELAAQTRWKLKYAPLSNWLARFTDIWPARVWFGS